MKNDIFELELRILPEGAVRPNQSQGRPARSAPGHRKPQTAGRGVCQVQPFFRRGGQPGHAEPEQDDSESGAQQLFERIAHTIIEVEQGRSDVGVSACEVEIRISIFRN